MVDTQSSAGLGGDGAVGVGEACVAARHSEVVVIGVVPAVTRESDALTKTELDGLLIHNSTDAVRSGDRPDLPIHKVRPGAQTRSVRFRRIDVEADTARLPRVDSPLGVGTVKGLGLGVAVDKSITAPAVET